MTIEARRHLLVARAAIDKALKALYRPPAVDEAEQVATELVRQPRPKSAGSFPDLQLVDPLPWPAVRAPLGYRLRNPGNIRASSSRWKGKVICPPGETSGYECFKTHGYGYRALLVLLLNYYNRHGLHSVKEIISRWAPHSDNNPTKAYIDQVAAMVDISPKSDLRFNDKLDGPANLYLVSRGIIRQELGGVPYTPSSMYNIVLRVMRGRTK